MMVTNAQTERTFTSQLVAWCRDCLWWLPEEEIGGSCPGEDCPRTLVKRRMWICSVPDCHQAYRIKGVANNHECRSEY